MSPPLVLIVDDNPENLTVIGELLQPEHGVRAANGGERALRLATLSPLPDLILLDVMMPQMDGFEVLARLRAVPALAEVPVIFLTALNSSADEERGLAMGAADYITKPIRPAVLLSRVRTHLELKRARDAARERERWLLAEVARRVDEGLGEGELVQDVGIRALARLAEGHDANAAHHLQRTQAIVRVLLRRMRGQGGQGPAIDDATAELIIRAMPLHDIGTAALPRALLLKTDPLSDADWTLLRSHALAGASALDEAQQAVARPLPLIGMARQIALHHHERWDGSGYPDGLAGPSIPLAARLAAVADVFDALVSPRAYRPAAPVRQAVDTVLLGRGTQFDPQVVDAFADGLGELQAIVLHHGVAESPAAGRRSQPTSARQASASASASASAPRGGAAAGPLVDAPLVLMR